MFRSILVTLLLVPASFAGEKAKPKLPFTISKETTFFTAPLDKSGRVDYITALNTRLAQGVTPENNAHVVLLSAMGPKPELARLPERHYKFLGIKEPPEKGDYFIWLHTFAREHLKLDFTERQAELDKQQEAAFSKPWTAAQYPILSQWLKANETPLNLMQEAAALPDHYHPLVTREDDPLAFALLSAAAKTRAMMSALSVRATLHLGEGRTTEAWQDIVTMNRLATLSGRRGSLTEGRLSIAFVNMVSGPTLTFLAHAKLDAKMARDCLRDLSELPPLTDLSDHVDLTERVTFLDAAQRISLPDGAFLAKLTEQLGRFNGHPLAKIELPDSLLEKIDWDPIFRRANVDTDRAVAALRSKDRLARRKKLAELDAEKAALEKAFDTDVFKVFADERATPAQLTNAMSILLSVAFRPSMTKLNQGREHAEQWQRNIQVAFALAAFQQEKGSYPKKLAELTPRYLPAVPDDHFSGKELIYRRTKDGYALYSVGRNGMDEEGRSYDDEPAGDDLTVRLPRRDK